MFNITIKKMILLISFFIMCFVTLSSCNNNKYTHFHTSDLKWFYDKDYHWHICDIDNERYDITRHSYGTIYKLDDSNHWLECICGKTKNKGTHVISEKKKFNDISHWNFCDICKKTYKTENHNLTWNNSETDHWTICSDCDYISGKKPHTIDYSTLQSNSDSHFYKCLECHQTFKEQPHSPNNVWVSDNDNHWQTCSICKGICNKNNHDNLQLSYDNYNHWYKCQTCNKDKINLEGHHKSDWQNDINSHWHLCTICSKNIDNSPHEKNLNHWFYDQINLNKGHWRECKFCKYELEASPHNWQQNNTYGNKFYYCSDCYCWKFE